MRCFPYTFLLLLFIPALSFAQPANDECVDAIPLNDIQDWCSENGAYSITSATASGFGGGSCMSNVSHDIWFSFIAIAPDVTLTIRGNTNISAGGTLSAPEVALYTGNCNGTINELQCENDATFSGIVELYKGGLTVGQTYLIRVDGRNNATGTFQMCIASYNPPVNPGSDCVTGAVLCDKSPFVVQAVSGPGNNPNELNGTPCLGAGVSQTSETNSSWFIWTCDQPGSLTFTLTPTNASDDLDFVVFELPNGLSDCGGIASNQGILCMASGDFNTSNPPCMGPTGLSENANGTIEYPGCSGGDDNFLQPLQMQSGVTYALAINNFTSTGNGFSIEFGGTGTFRGPEAAFSTDATDNTICIGQTITVNDASSVPASDNIVGWSWNFGVGATPATASGPGPHTLAYNSIGNKSITLTIENEQGGCIVTTIEDVVVAPCCETLNQMTLSGTATELECYDNPIGEVNLTVASPFPITSFEWSNGADTEDLTGLTGGTYTVTVTNTFCEEEATFNVSSPPPFLFDTLMTLATCNGGTNGSLTLGVSGASPPYEFQWFDSPGFVQGDDNRSSLSIGFYAVTVRDANGCQVEHLLEVRELILEIDPQVQAAIPPSCYGYEDGSVTLEIINGLAPYQFDWNDGNGFVDENSIQQLAEGTYTATAIDANGCLGQFSFGLEQPDTLVVALDALNVRCFGESNGQAIPTVTGGTTPYLYDWDNGQSDSVAVNLPIGIYSVVVTDANGCTAHDTTEVVQPPELILENISVVDVVCFGDSTGQATLSALGGSPPFQYGLDTLSYQDDSLFTGIPSGMYQGFVVDALGCLDSLGFTVVQPPELIADAGADTTVALGYSTVLEGSVYPLFKPVDIVWSPDYNLDCVNCIDPMATPYQTTTYYFEITDNTGCVDVDSVTVSVDPLRPVYIPNTFTPNADGANDFFTAFGGPAVAGIESLMVFERWGGLVYEGRDLPIANEAAQEGWDGTFNGKAMNPGVYVYLIRIRFVDGEKQSYSGDITLLR